eukprot:NODE_4678_length_776_cov_7.074278_g3890_i0.p1 GENE.NODE_4678_length_776_cov_7.074278_g3890_i0~~NODE_4678_length_776_cov_7.074278_g3890_i0.p1  ORF type:complete len:231 (-),score=25.83 NODE_4678_length_776_cov_7.074278_g3890_i0:82-753(-)
MADKDKEKILLKVVLLGDAGVGKTCLLNRLVHNRFSTIYKATIGADFWTKEMEVDGEIVTMQIWDTAGQERFQSLGMAFYRGSDVCVLVFDVNSESSFQHMSSWRTCFLEQVGASSDSFPFSAVGNKIDVDPTERQIDGEQARQWCGRVRGNIRYFETSAKDGTNIEAVFTDVARRYLSARKEKKQAEDAKRTLMEASVQLTNSRDAEVSDDSAPRRKSSTCC